MSHRRELTEMTAGELAYGDFPMGDPELDSIVEAAAVVWESVRSTWLFVELWPDGTTVWREPDDRAVAVVSPDGEIHEELLE